MLTITETKNNLIKLNKQNIENSFRLFLNSTKNDLLKQIDSDFENSRSPNGNRWLPLKYRIGKPLILTGNLKENKTIQVGKDNLNIIFREHYAKYQNFGTDKIPARPFLPNKTTPKKWNEIIENNFREKFIQAISK